jgi:flagellar FliJ protein
VRPCSSSTERVQIDASIELSRRDAEVAVRREALATAARDRQAIDKLKERRKAEHDAEQVDVLVLELALEVDAGGGQHASRFGRIL